MTSISDMMEAKSSKDLAIKNKALVEKWGRILNNGKQEVLYSFLAVSKDTERFGVLTMPEDFVARFGHTLPLMIGLSCKKVLWCVDYSIERKEICNLNRFKNFYRVKVLNLVQFDYVGGGLFMIRIFKDTAFESKYPARSANYVESSKELEELNRAQYVLDTNTLESEKAIASISFNACSNRTDYTYLMFEESDIDQSRGNMILSPIWEEYYKHWEDGSFVVFKYLEKSWTINIEKRGEVCYLGKGLLEFVSGTGMKDRDFLVAFREKEEIHDCLRFCIYDQEDHGLEFVKVLSDPVPANWSKSFFKIVYENASDRGLFMVPFLVNEFYRWKLSQIKLLYVGGLDWGFKYKPFPGYIFNLEDMIMHFRLQEKDTIIFTFNESDIMYGRVYQSNGVEIDYRSRTNNRQADSADDWIWSFEEKPKSGEEEVYASDDPMDVDYDAGVLREFSTCLTVGNVDKKTHGLFIPPTIKPASGVWKRTQKIKFVTDKGVWDIGITNTPIRPRFTAGWNKFIRDNEYRAGQMLNFTLVEHDEYTDFIIRNI